MPAFTPMRPAKDHWAGSIDFSEQYASFSSSVKKCEGNAHLRTFKLTGNFIVVWCEVHQRGGLHGICRRSSDAKRAAKRSEPRGEWGEGEKELSPFSSRLASLRRAGYQRGMSINASHPAQSRPSYSDQFVARNRLKWTVFPSITRMPGHILLFPGRERTWE